MIHRRLEIQLIEALNENASVALLGPRQVGKTTLARSILPADAITYVDLEDDFDRNKVRDFKSFYAQHREKLIVLDEIQKMPDIFSSIRGIIDEQRREGRKTGLFLFLGSASMDLLKQSGESLAGRIAYMELYPVDLLEYAPAQMNQTLWLRGGFPESLLAVTDKQSMNWRKHFIRTYLERDIPQIGPRIPAETLARFWTMLAHQQGSTINMSSLARGIDVSVTTANRYLDLMVDLLLVRRLKPFAFNAGKRLVKAPKVYVRDSGITHALLNINNLDELMGHPVCGASWEGYVIENILSVCPAHYQCYFYRTSQGAEIDLVIETSYNNLIAIEIKKSSNPSVTKGFHIACDDIKAIEKYVVYSGHEIFSLGNDITAISLTGMMQKLTAGNT